MDDPYERIGKSVYTQLTKLRKKTEKGYRIIGATHVNASCWHNAVAEKDGKYYIFMYRNDNYRYNPDSWKLDEKKEFDIDELINYFLSY